MLHDESTVTWLTLIAESQSSECRTGPFSGRKKSSTGRGPRERFISRRLAMPTRDGTEQRRHSTQDNLPTWRSPQSACKFSGFVERRHPDFQTCCPVGSNLVLDSIHGHGMTGSSKPTPIAENNNVLVQNKAMDLHSQAANASRSSTGIRVIRTEIRTPPVPPRKGCTKRHIFQANFNEMNKPKPRSSYLSVNREARFWSFLGQETPLLNAKTTSLSTRRSRDFITLTQRIHVGRDLITLKIQTWCIRRQIHMTEWWACRDSNPEPRDYESPALTVELQARTRSYKMRRRSFPERSRSLQNAILRLVPTLVSGCLCRRLHPKFDTVARRESLLHRTATCEGLQRAGAMRISPAHWILHSRNSSMPTARCPAMGRPQRAKLAMEQAHLNPNPSERPILDEQNVVNTSLTYCHFQWTELEACCKLFPSQR